jgi:mannose-1-phosphate guanylyltransferase/phosphomannomutase
MVIIAGGQGSRMRSVLRDLPKCLVEIEGKTLLERNMANLKQQGIYKFQLLLGVGADAILKKVSGIASTLQISIDYTIEESPLGTGGAIINALESLDPNFFVVHGDLLVNTDLRLMRQTIEDSSTIGAQMYHPSTHMHDSDLLKITDDGFVSDYFPKSNRTGLNYRNHGNAGLYLFKKEAFQNQPSSKLVMDLDRDFLPYLLEKGNKIRAIRNIGYIKDAGTPDRLKEVSQDFKNVRKTRILRPAIFLDRDGTLNVGSGHVSSPDQIELFSDCVDLIKRCNQKGFRVIVITNQPVVARGEATYDDVDSIHGRIDCLLAKSGAFVDDYYYCPHHPDSGFDHEIPDLKMVCQCRKPNIGLFIRASENYPTLLSDSFMVGDSWRDIEAGKAFGIKTVYINRDHSEFDLNVQPDFTVENLGNFAI